MRLVQTKAEAVAAQFGTNDPFSIAQRLEIEIYEQDMPSRIKGILYNIPGHVAIALNKNLPYPERRAALAHELGHYFLHPHLSFSLLVADRLQHSKKERQANEFAAALLIGSTALSEGKEIWEIAEEYDVPADLVRLRFSDPPAPYLPSPA